MMDVFAPGKNIVTTSFINGNNDYVSADGSSLFTAMVSGVIALVKEVYTNLSTQDIKDYFKTDKILNSKK